MASRMPGASMMQALGIVRRTSAGPTSAATSKIQCCRLRLRNVQSLCSCLVAVARNSCSTEMVYLLHCAITKCMMLKRNPVLCWHTKGRRPDTHAGLESGGMSGGSGSGAQTTSAVDALFPVPSMLNAGFQVCSLRCCAKLSVRHVVGVGGSCFNISFCAKGFPAQLLLAAR